MAAIILDCPSCRRKLRVPDEFQGKPVKCPTCDQIFQAPAALGTTLPTAAALQGESVPSNPSQPPPPEVERQPSRTEKQAVRSCPRCQGEVDAQAERCPYCGEPFEVEEEDHGDRPWESGRPFTGRRDAEPHRGTLILTLGIVSIVLFAFCGLIGLPLGIAAWVMGRTDLRKMRQNLMDPAGEGNTRAGWICGIIGTILDSLWMLACLGYVAIVVTAVTNAPRMPAPPMPPPVRPVPPPPVPMPQGDKAAWLPRLPERPPVWPGPERKDDHARSHYLSALSARLAAAGNTLRRAGAMSVLSGCFCD